MNKKVSISIAMLAVIGFSCKSLVTQKDILKQQQEAEEAVKEAHEKLLDLAELKERYSVDRGIAEMNQLEKRQKTIEKDIDKIEDLKGAGTIEAAENILNNLKAESNSISTRISMIKNTPKESWQVAIAEINRDIKSLENQISLMTNNVIMDQ